jgi:beta-glucanase (GH16 family)
MLAGVSVEAQVTYGLFGGFHDDLATYDDTLWRRSSWSNGLPFFCTFAEANTRHINGKLELKITDDGAGGYDCAEYQSKAMYGYGTYSARIKAASGPGVVTGFFVYTGEWGEPSHQEIDFEFLGKKPWKVQLNYFVGGVGDHEVKVDLGFDASAGYHTYTFKWSPTMITWSVDGVVVYTKAVTNSQDLPQPPAKVMVNLWNGPTSLNGEDENDDAVNWLEPFAYPGTAIQARVEWIEFVSSELVCWECLPIDGP